MPSTKRRVYIHVGCRKSGTSALQAAIRTSRETLAEQGLGLPLVERLEHYNGILAPLTSFGDDEAVPPRVTEAMARLRSAAAATPGSRLLLTMEDLAELDARRAALLVDALDEFEVHIIVSARDWARQIPSEWQQDVKQRSLLPYADFVAAVRDRTADADLFYARQDVPAIAARWGAHLPPERVHVVTVPQQSDGKQLFELFAQVINIDPSSLQVVGARNPSLGYEQAETLRRVNVALGDRLVNFRRDYRFAVRSFIYHGALRKQDGIPLGLPSELAEWCHEVTASQAKQLAEGGYDIVGVVDDLISPNRPATTEDFEVTDDQVAQVAVRALADLAVLRHSENKKAAADKRAAEKAAAEKAVADKKATEKAASPSQKPAQRGAPAQKAGQRSQPGRPTTPASGPAERVGRRIDRVLRGLRRRVRGRTSPKG